MGLDPVRRLCMTTKIKVEVDTFTGLRDTYYVHICNTCVCVILWSWCMNAAMDADVGSRLIPHRVGVHCWTARWTVVSVLWGVQTASDRCQTAACQCWGMVTHTHQKSLICRWLWSLVVLKNKISSLVLALAWRSLSHTHHSRSHTPYCIIGRMLFYFCLASSPMGFNLMIRCYHVRY